MASSLDIAQDQFFHDTWSNCDLSPNVNTSKQSDVYQQPYQIFQTQSEPTPTQYSSKTNSKGQKETKPNLLKNLVATLRSWVKFRDGKDGKLECEVWKYFKQCKKINKHLVWTVFGNIEEEPERLAGIVKQIPSLSGIDVENFKKIQQNIRKETLQQLKKADIQFVLKYRRVIDRKVFNCYFYEFVEKLEKGQVECRKNK